MFPSTPRSSEWSVPFRFSDKNSVCYISSLPCVPHTLIDLIILISGGAYKLWRCSLCSLLQPLSTFSLWGPNLTLKYNRNLEYKRPLYITHVPVSPPLWAMLQDRTPLKALCFLKPSSASLFSRAARIHVRWDGQLQLSQVIWVPLL
jgi:hypothetical protein